MHNTRIRYISSKSIDDIMAFVKGLSYKVEIKGNPVDKGNKWFLFYILPEISVQDFGNLELN